MIVLNQGGAYVANLTGDIRRISHALNKFILLIYPIVLKTIKYNSIIFWKVMQEFFLKNPFFVGLIEDSVGLHNLEFLKNLSIGEFE